MRKEIKIMIEMGLYADSTDLYTEYECNEENGVYLRFPKEMVRQYFKETQEETYRIDESVDSDLLFEEWLINYDYGDTNDLYYYAKEHGFQPERKIFNDNDVIIINAAKKCGISIREADITVYRYDEEHFEILIGNELWSNSLTYEEAEDQVTCLMKGYSMGKKAG